MIMIELTCFYLKIIYFVFYHTVHHYHTYAYCNIFRHNLHTTVNQAVRPVLIMKFLEPST